ncbi:MAG: hypothetical protein ABIG42_05130, partial [bacterium]
WNGELGYNRFSSGSNHMQGRISITSTIGTCLITCLVFFVLYNGCASVGGKGYRNADAGQDQAERTTLQGEIETQANINPVIPTREASDRDPFGLIPLGWPDFVPLHEDGYVAFSSTYGTGGFRLMVIVSPKLATIPGVQDFYEQALTSLNGWDTYTVDEMSPGNSSGIQLNIRAGRDNGNITIIVNQGNLAGYSVIENLDYWDEVTGPEAIVISLNYQPGPTG